MRLLHTSDWHLGMTFRGGLSYREDQEYFIRQISQIALDEKVDGIMIAGDIFDKSIASQEAIKLYDDAMTLLCGKLNIPVFIVAGNHDGAERLASCHALLKKSGLYVAGALTKDANIVSVGDVDIYLLPWISTDKVKTIYPEKAEQITSLEDAYKVVLDQYREGFSKDKRHVIISHAFIVDAETSVSDRAAEVGKATMIGSHVFEGFDYVALGHLHGPQKINETMRYSGTPMAYSFGKEETQEKSVVLIDTDTMQQTLIPILQKKKRTTISDTYSKLLEANYPEEVIKGYVRLNVTDSYAGMEAISALKEHYPYLLEITSKSLEREDAKITMTIEEFENAQDSPETVFERYCEDILESAPSKHFMDMFHRALGECAKEVD